MFRFNPDFFKTMSNQTSPHILGTSANLLGFCLFVITALHISDSEQLTIIDELTVVISMLLAISTLLSFLSIRSSKTKHKVRFETFADYFFAIALIGILVVILLIALNIIS